jgi:AraC family transcriptional regulator of adaptative response/methylated-DNA-[protein]-cysteine methyltransferase
MFYGRKAEMMISSNFRGEASIAIHFAIGACSLGPILVARSAHGVCAVLIGDDPVLLAQNLRDQFPRANLIEGENGCDELVARVARLIERPGARLDLPLDIGGTAFQQRVWRALQQIPIGSTASCADIAKRIGKPMAVRAVAKACSANVLAVAIPCHRVVRNDGSLRGYRWGMERKRALLDREARAYILAAAMAGAGPMGTRLAG